MATRYVSLDSPGARILLAHSPECFKRHARRASLHLFSLSSRSDLQIGLLPPGNHQQIRFAYEMYKREDLEGLQLSEMFKRSFCRDVTVEFLGVWYVFTANELLA